MSMPPTLLQGMPAIAGPPDAAEPTLWEFQGMMGRRSFARQRAAEPLLPFSDSRHGGARSLLDG